ncbi:MAG: Holliday junction branch migration protein RuvA [Alphaproteobacteria bacterium]
MIGKLSGIIDSIDTGHFILDVSGVGYVVFSSGRTLSKIGQIGDAACVLITTNVREDAITLYGFADAIEQGWFKLLTSVQGVGAKAGLSILSACPADELGFAIAAQDKAVFTRADGVGPKLATRILTELKDKASKLDLSFGAQSVTSVQGGANAPLMNPKSTENASNVDHDAVSALTNLGYASSDAFRAVSMVKTQSSEQDNLQDIIRLALKELSA